MTLRHSIGFFLLFDPALMAFFAVWLSSTEPGPEKYVLLLF
jgi:hypothetical protein